MNSVDDGTRSDVTSPIKNSLPLMRFVVATLFAVVLGFLPFITEEEFQKLLALKSAQPDVPVPLEAQIPHGGPI
jgi:hypothetical protein